METRGRGKTGKLMGSKEITMATVNMACKDCISIVTIDNPPDNHLDLKVLSGLNTTVSKTLRPETDLRVVLLAATGRHFSKGVDYERLRSMERDEVLQLAEAGYRLMKQIEGLSVPVVASLKGETTGAGLALALAADVRIAASDALFSFPEARLGLPPLFGSSQRLYKTVGVGRAKELLFTGRTVDAQEALAIGLVNKVVPADALDEEAERLAVQIGRNSLGALRTAKMLINFGLNEGYESGLRQEVTALGDAFDPATKQWERM